MFKKFVKAVGVSVGEAVSFPSFYAANPKLGKLTNFPYGFAFRDVSVSPSRALFGRLATTRP